MAHQQQKPCRQPEQPRQHSKGCQHKPVHAGIDHRHRGHAHQHPAAEADRLIAQVLLHAAGFAQEHPRAPVMPVALHVLPAALAVKLPFIMQVREEIARLRVRSR